MKQILSILGTLILTAVFIVALFWGSSILVFPMYSPQVTATVLVIGYIFLSIFCISDLKANPQLCTAFVTFFTIVLSVILFIIAGWFEADIQSIIAAKEAGEYLEYDLPSTPRLLLTWGWKTQAVISVILGWIAYKFSRAILEK